MADPQPPPKKPDADDYFVRERMEAQKFRGEHRQAQLQQLHEIAKRLMEVTAKAARAVSSTGTRDVSHPGFFDALRAESIHLADLEMLTTQAKLIVVTVKSCPVLAPPVFNHSSDPPARAIVGEQPKGKS